MCFFIGVVFVLVFLILGSLVQIDIKFILDWKFEGLLVLFFIVFDKGYFVEEDLNVIIDFGVGFCEFIFWVVIGIYDMGFGDINVFIKVLDDQFDLKVKVVMMVYEILFFVVIGCKSQGVIEDLKLLEGKMFGVFLFDVVFG